MRKRGAIAILAAMPAWIYFVRFDIEARKSPFGYELGSAVFPYPQSVRAAGIFASLLTFWELCFLALDFDRWIRRSRSK
jgi:hypothetical protein